MSRISLVQLAGSVRKFNLNRPFIWPILETRSRPGSDSHWPNGAAVGSRIFLEPEQA
jgi:hypothetical protein